MGRQGDQIDAVVAGILQDRARRLPANHGGICHQRLRAQTLGDFNITPGGYCSRAAGGLAGRAQEGAVAVGRFAFAVLDAIERQPPLGGRKLGLRIGIHCGPATAGVIGDTRFSYDVWGDAVNTASRMESHGLAGRIHVSESFRALAGDAFVYDERGATDIKSLGASRTYFLRRREAQSLPKSA